MACAALSLLLLAPLLPGSRADAFLGKQGQSHVQTGQDILLLLEEELGSGHGRADAARVALLQEELRHTFAALPKNVLGNLQAAGARYALHRLFVQRHAWQLTGLEPGGAGWGGAAASGALGDRVPDKVRSFFEKKLGQGGVGLHELAVLAALLESMIHTETEERLQVALEATNQTWGSLDQQAATAVLHAYMASYVLGVPLKDLSPEAVRKHVRSVDKLYPTWPDTQRFVEAVRDEVSPGPRYDFAALSGVLEAVGDRYGRWQSRECSELKGKLQGLEARPGSGRVLLSDFYGSALSGENWQFSESVDYLRQLGALDESNPSQPSVIIPNYIGSPSNCVASSGYYAVCCIDECEEIMDRLEHRIAAPSASAEAIAEALGNDTLPAATMRRLQEVATFHKGSVPLHGRLFAQWLHHAFPGECPFPHITGTTNPRQAEDFLQQTGGRVSATNEEMRQFAEAARQAQEEPEEGLCSNMWTMEEELVDADAHEAHHAPAQRRPLKALMLCLALASAAATIAKMALSAHTADPAQKAPAAVRPQAVTHSV